MVQRAFEAHGVEITVNVATSGVFPIDVQVSGPTGEDMKYVSAVEMYLSSDAAGAVLAIDSTTTSEFVIGTDGLMIESVTDIAGVFISEDDGDIDVEVTVISGFSAYLNVILPNGRVVTGGEMSYDGS